jgi:hypothetical protein
MSGRPRAAASGDSPTADLGGPVISSARLGNDLDCGPQAVERAIAVVHVLATRSRSFRTRQDDQVPVGVAKPNEEVILGLLDGAWIQTYFAQPPMLGFHR